MRKNRQKYVRLNEKLSLFDQVVELYTNYKRSFFKIINNKQLEYLKNFIITSTSFLPANTKIIIRIYCILQNITSLPKCKTCGKPIPIKLNKYKRFNYYCNASCRQHDTNVYLKQCSEKLKTYGSVNNVNKTLSTKKEKYGIAGYNNPKQANITKFKKFGSSMYDHEKYRLTSNRLYGADNYMQTENGKAHYRKEIEKKYGPGISNPAQLPETRLKSKITKKKRYNNENYNNPEQAKITCMKLYGVEHIAQCPKFQNHRSLYFYNNQYFDSKPELAYYIWLTDNKIKFEYHGSSYFEYEFQGKTYRYFPDFKLLDSDIFIEIKGDQFFKSDGTMYCPYKNKKWTPEYYDTLCQHYEAKHQCMLKHDVQILRNNEYKKFIKYIDEKYGKKYLNSKRVMKK